MHKIDLKKTIENSIRAKKSLLLIEDKISLAINTIFEKLSKGGKIFLCGNGGSAADAQHLAAEFLEGIISDSIKFDYQALHRRYHWDIAAKQTFEYMKSLIER